MGNRVRGFEKISTWEEEDIHLPVRKTAKSAGYDIESPTTFTINPHRKVVLGTGLKAYMQDDEYLALHIRSSIGIKRGLQLMNGTGIIDADYYNNPDNEGHIMLALVNTTDEPVKILTGECIAQGIFEKYLLTDDDYATAERVGGMGSTSK